MISSAIAANYSSSVVMALPTWVALILALMVVTSAGNERRTLTRAYLWSQPAAWILATALSFASWVLFRPGGARAWLEPEVFGVRFELLSGAIGGAASWVLAGMWIMSNSRAESRVL